MKSVKHSLGILLFCIICISQGTLLWAQSIHLPEWTKDENASIHFASSVSANAEHMPASIYGFSGTAFGISVIEEAVLIERFELDTPPSGSFKTPTEVPLNYKPMPVLHKLRFIQSSTNSFEVDCSFEPSSDSNELGIGGIQLLLSNWYFVIEKAQLGPDGLSLIDSFIMNDFSGTSASSGKVFVLANLDGFIFDKQWNPIEGFNRLHDPNFSGRLSGKQSDEMIMSRLDGKLVIDFDIKPDQNGKDDSLFFKTARLDGQGNLTVFDPSETIVHAGKPGNFQTDFSIRLDSGSAKGTGIIHFPPSLGGGSYSSAIDGIMLPQDSTTSASMLEEIGVFVSAFAEPVKIQAQGWEIILPNAQANINEYDKSISSTNAIISYQGVSIELEELTIKADGSFSTTSVISDDLYIPMYGGQAQIMEASFGNDGLIMQGAIQFGDELGEAVAYFDNLGLDANGDIFYTHSGRLRPLTIRKNSAVIRLEDFNLSKESLIATTGSISFKWNDTDQVIPIQAAWIDSVGTISILLKRSFLRLNDLVFWISTTENQLINDQGIMIQGYVDVDNITRHNEKIIAQLLFDNQTRQARLILNGDDSQTFRNSTNGWFGKGSSLIWLGENAILAFEKVLINPSYEGFHLTNITVSNGGVWDYSKAGLSNPFQLEHNKVIYILDQLQPIGPEPTWLEFKGRAIRTEADGKTTSYECSVKLTTGSITAKIADESPVQWLLVPRQR